MARAPQVWGATILIPKGTKYRNGLTGRKIHARCDEIRMAFSRRMMGVFTFWWWEIKETGNVFYVHKDLVTVMKEFPPKEIAPLVKSDKAWQARSRIVRAKKYKEEKDKKKKGEKNG